MVKVEWTEASLKDLNGLDKTITQRIIKKISWLSHNFENIIPESLSQELKGAYKLRIGDWRVVYSLEDNVIVIQFIGHRSKIYKIK